MKNKTSILVKTRHFFYALLVAVIFCGCEESTVKEDKSIAIIGGVDVYTYTIDSCEYVGWLKGTNGDWATHKGNCKFCAERSKK